MAKEVRSKYTLDATSVVKSIKDVGTSLKTHNEAVKRVTTSTRDQNKATKDAVAALGRSKDKVQQLNRSLSSLNRTLPSAVKNFRDASRASRSFSTSMGTAKSNVQAASAQFRSATVAAGQLVVQMRDASRGFQVSNNALRRTVVNMTALDRQTKILTQAMIKKNASLKTQNKLHNQNVNALGRSSRSGRRFVRVVVDLTSVSRILVATAFHRFFLRTAQAMIRAIDESRELSIRIREIRTISDRAALSVREWNDQLTQLSESFGIGVLDVAEASYQALSNQVTEAATSQQFLREEMRLSIITASTLADSVSATTAIINAYGLTVDDARRVNNVFFATVERGRLRLEDLSNTIGRVGILSAELGITLTEQNAAIALLTRRGVSAAEAMTFLRNVELKLIKPTEEMQRILDQWGVSSGRAAITAFGFAGTLERLQAEAARGGDELTELGEIFGRIRATIGGVGLTSADLRGEMALLEKASTGATGAFADSMEGLGRRANIQVEKMKKFFRELGEIALRAFVRISESAGGADRILRRIGQFLVRAVRIWISYRAGVLAASIAQGIFRARLIQTTAEVSAQEATMRAATFTANAYAAAVGIAIGAAVLFATEIATAGQRLEDFDKALKANVVTWDDYADRIAAAGAAQERFIRDTFAVFHRGIAANRAILNRMAEDAEDAFERLGDSVRDSFKDALKEVSERIRELKKEIRDLERSVTGRRERAAETRFESRITGERARAEFGVTDEATRIKRLLALRNKLMKEADEALRAGNVDSFNRLAQEIERIQQEAIESVRRRQEEAAIATKRIRVEGFEIDPLTGRPRRRTRTFEGPDEEAQKRSKKLLAELNELERQRAALVEFRVRVEERAAAAEEKRKTDLEAELRTREAAFEKLQELVSKLDTFATPGRKGVAEFGALLTAAEAEAGRAGLDPRAQFEIFRDLRKRQLELSKQAAAEELQARLDAIQRRVKAEQQALEASVQAQTQARQAQQTAAENFVATFESQVKAIEEFAGTLAPKSIASDAQEEQNQNLDQLSQLVTQAQQQIAQFREQTSKGIFDPAAVVSINETIKSFTELERRVAALDIKLDRFGLQGSRRRVPGTVFSIFESATGNQPGFDFNDETLNEFLKTSQEALFKLAQTFRETNQTIQEQGNIRQRLQELGQQAQQLAPIVQQLERTTQTAMGNAAQSVQGVTNAYQNLTAAIQESIRATQRVQGPRGRGANFGGRIRAFQFGGRAFGSDTIPAMLREGESVLTRAASRTFAPLIGALNSATAGNTGTGTSVNFGDINISAAPGTTEDQIREIVDGIQRHLRLGLGSIS